MKRYIIFLMIGFLFFIVGCSNSTTSESLELDKEIVGEWETTISHDQDTGVIETTMTYDFNEDGTYELETENKVKGEDGNTITEDSSVEGHYTIDGDKLELKATMINGDTVDEELEAVDDTSSDTSYDSSTPSKETSQDYSNSTYTISLEGNTLTLTIGDTEYTLTRVE